jgi:hypothetical protein
MKLKFSHLLLALAFSIATATGVLIGNAHAGQPHMDNALTALHNAHRQLEMARPDKGGHRERALGMIDNAIAEVQAGISAGE